MDMKTRTKEALSCRLNFQMADEGCRYCPALRWDKVGDIRTCYMTGEILLDWKYFRGRDCPLIVKKGEKEDDVYGE